MKRFSDAELAKLTRMRDIALKHMVKDMMNKAEVNLDLQELLCWVASNAIVDISFEETKRQSDALLNKVTLQQE